MTSQETKIKKRFVFSKVFFLRVRRNICECLIFVLLQYDYSETFCETLVINSFTFVFYI